MGLDSEFDGVDFANGDNCVGRSVLDVWSLAVPDEKKGLHPRGYMQSRGVVLSRSVLPIFKGILEDASIKKFAHNSTVDVHTFNNHGVDVVGVINTLTLARFTFPERFKYGLDDLSKEFLDDAKYVHYEDMCSEPIFEWEEWDEVYCSCGQEGCRKRKPRNEGGTWVVHDKITEHKREYLPTKKMQTIPISSITPLSKRWTEKLNYAACDAVLAHNLGDYCNRKLKQMTYDNYVILRN